jgi:hypothetical protein
MLAIGAFLEDKIRMVAILDDSAYKKRKKKRCEFEPIDLMLFKNPLGTT